MLETPHVVVGAAIAVNVANPALAIPLALGSHFILDRIPHWNPHLYTETQKTGKPSKSSTFIGIADITLSLIIGVSIAAMYLPDFRMATVVLMCCLAAVLPDVVKYPYYFFKVRADSLVKWVNFERSLQVDTTFHPGMATQIITIIIGFWWIFS